MPYILEKCVAGNTIEYRKYYSMRAHPQKEKNEGTSDPEKKTKDHMRRAETNLRRLMNANFKDGDYLVTLDYFRDIPKDSKEMQKEMQNFITRLKRKFKKEDKSLKYIYVKEVGPKGSRHIHMLVNQCPVEWIRESWKVGGIHINPLYSQGQYAQIASYFIKYSKKTEETEGKLVGKRWYGSRTLIKPRITKRIIKANRYSEKIKHKKGFFLDKSSVESGVNIFGYSFFAYTLIKIPKEGG